MWFYVKKMYQRTLFVETNERREIIIMIYTNHSSLCSLVITVPHGT